MIAGLLFLIVGIFVIGDAYASIRRLRKPSHATPSEFAQKMPGMADPRSSEPFFDFKQRGR